ncbi:murein biosynthesis integral membrane protein MurJ [Nocardioides jishulii]|nr:murein biosynthesis integral membrane protein MurJ [Nocardioides jishulii]
MSAREPDGAESPVPDSPVPDSPVPEKAKQSILASSAVMAAGTTFSRFSGFIRSALLVAALGNGIQADTFQVANTVPNMLYILLAGGVFNAVLVPQLVRALKNDADGGEAYTNRIITLAALFLGAVSVLLVALAPAVMALMLDNQYDSAALAAQRESAIVLARYCLPQVFFYGMFVLVGQVLNARGSFGPMMWAPIANNVIAVAVLGTYLVVFGPAADPSSALTAERELLLGVGSTVGIAVQFLILVPVLRRVGFRYRPRFDFRHTGLGHTFRLAVWTVLFVVVNQAAYVVVTRLATRGSADGGTGATVYGNTYLLTMLPHGIVTVSLVTALLPRLSAYAADGSLGRVGTTLASTLRTAMLVVLPYAALLAVIGGDMANVIFGFGAGQGAFASYRPGLAVFAVALVFFTVHFFMLRGFYALEQTRTVFLVQCVVGTVNVGAAIALVAVAPPRMTVAALAAAYALAYLAGSIVSWWVLRRQVGGLDERRTARFAVRMLAVVAISTAISYAVWWLLGGNDPDPTSLGSFLRGAVVGLCQLITYLVLTKVFRIREMAEIIEPVRNAVLRRLGRV